jgi:hypothetical protein
MSGPPPAEPLPPSVAAENKGPLMLALTWSFTSFASLLVAGRIIARRKKLGRLKADDYIIIGSLVCHAIQPLILPSTPELTSLP